MSDTALRDLVLKRLEFGTKPEDAWSTLVLAALEGSEAFQGLLDSKVHPQQRPKQAAPQAPTKEPLGAYLKAITVEGFRGIGQRTWPTSSPRPSALTNKTGTATARSAIAPPSTARGTSTRPRKCSTSATRPAKGTKADGSGTIRSAEFGARRLTCVSSTTSSP